MNKKLLYQVINDEIPEYKKQEIASYILFSGLFDEVTPEELFHKIFITDEHANYSQEMQKIVSILGQNLVNRIKLLLDMKSKMKSKVKLSYRGATSLLPCRIRIEIEDIDFIKDILRYPYGRINGSSTIEELTSHFFNVEVREVPSEDVIIYVDLDAYSEAIDRLSEMV